MLLSLRLLLPTVSEAAPRAAADPVWQPGLALSDPSDRSLATVWMKEQYYCGQSAEACSQFDAARIRSPSTADTFLALRTASGGTCGAYELALYGPAAGGGRRAGPNDAPILSDCGEALSLRPGQELPDVVTEGFVDRSRPDGPVLETRLWRWSGREYRIVSRSRRPVQAD